MRTQCLGRKLRVVVGSLNEELTITRFPLYYALVIVLTSVNYTPATRSLALIVHRKVKRIDAAASRRRAGLQLPSVPHGRRRLGCMTGSLELKFPGNGWYRTQANTSQLLLESGLTLNSPGGPFFSCIRIS